MVGEDDAVARFQHVTEVLYGLVNGQQLAVVCAIFLLEPGLIFVVKKARDCQAVLTPCCRTVPWQAWRRL
jgi:hypothetical protein